MKHWFIWAIAALLVTGAQAADKEKSANKKKGGGFAAIDKDGDGQISEKEFLAVEKAKAKKSGNEFDEEMATEKFESLDADGDGFLSKSEMPAKGKKKPKKDESNEDDE